MNRLFVAGVLAALSFRLAATGQAVEQSDKPNILFIITDQHHARMLSSAGNPYLKTRALDSMARSGIRFSRAYVCNPVCVPSRISMATGVMAGRFGVFNNGMKATIPKEVSTNSLGKLIKAGGYDTFYGGKVHMAPELTPLKAGYDEYCKDQRDKLPEACIEFMTRKRDKPFFAVASFINPHDICFAYNARQPNRKGKPLVDRLYREAQALPADQLPPLPDNSAVPKREPNAIEANMKEISVTPAKLIRKDYNNRDWRNYRWIYCRLTERVDAQIGRLLDALKVHDLEKNTLVIFTSDHGDMDGSHRLASKNVFYENSVGVPFMMQYKGVIPAGVVDNNSLVSNGLDVLPTLCDYAGVSIPNYLLGRTLRPVAEGRGDNARRPYVVAENNTGRMLRSDRYKYCVYTSGVIRESLVDLKTDPGEMKNLAGLPQFHKTLNQHRDYLKQWIVESKDTPAKSFAIAPD
ncbi:MAG: sulfatase-like hydrolase/transferase [Pedosphaera sp.]|jgi:arylsulfatase A-like enzyme|nr:sulfatase-like hydrolase/transferase [Pedosphaera sp.]